MSKSHSTNEVIKISRKVKAHTFSNKESSTLQTATGLINCTLHSILTLYSVAFDLLLILFLCQLVALTHFHFITNVFVLFFFRLVQMPNQKQNMRYSNRSQYKLNVCKIPHQIMTWENGKTKKRAAFTYSKSEISFSKRLSRFKIKHRIIKALSIAEIIT